MIKNWKLFLESSSHGPEEEELKRHAEELKASLKKVFSPILSTEEFLRYFKMNDAIKNSVDMIYEGLIGGFNLSIDSKFQNQAELAETLKTFFKKTLDRAKIVMIEKSFEEGIDFMIDEYVKFMIDFVKSQIEDSEDDDKDEDDDWWKTSPKKDYSQMSKKEIQDLIDDALSDRDFELVHKLAKYLESHTPKFESNSYKDLPKFDNCIKEFCNLLIDFITDYFLVKTK